MTLLLLSPTVKEVKEEIYVKLFARRRQQHHQLTLASRLNYVSTCDLITLTLPIRPLYRSRVSRDMASFLPIFSLLRNSVLGLGSGMGQTDRQTDGQTDRLTDNGHQRLMPPSYAGGGIKCGLTHQIKEFFRRVDNLY